MDAPLVFATSSAATRRLALAREFLLEHAESGLLVLAPTRGAADDLLYGCVAPAEGEGARGVLGTERFTVAQLAAVLAAPALAETGRAPVGDVGAEALATLVALALGPELEHFGPVAHLPGFPRALRATLAELRLAGVEAAALSRLDEPAMRDLAKLLSAYEAELEHHRLSDYAHLLGAARAALAASGDGGRDAFTERGALAGRPAIWLDLAPRHLFERRVLEQLAGVLGAVLWTGSRHDAETAAWAEEIGASRRELDEDPGADRLARAQQWVFAETVPPRDGDELDDAGELVFFSSGGEGQECLEIARRVRDLAGEGVPFDQIAVAVRHPSGYLPLLQDAFSRAGIPATYSRGTARPDPSGRAFLALLACAAEDLSASRFAEYLSLGQVPPLEADATPPARSVPWVEPEGEQFVLATLEPVQTATGESGEGGGGASATDAEEAASELADDESPAPAGTLPLPLEWERLLVDAAVVGGAERWRRRLDGLEAELERRIAEAADEEPQRCAALERDRDRLMRLRAFSLPLVEQLGALPQQAKWAQWLEHLERLAARALRRPRSVLELLAHLRPMSEVGPVTLAQVQRTLEERLTTLELPPPKHRYGRVLVATIAELAGRELAALFVPGLAEGLFPGRSNEDPLLLDSARRRLEEEGIAALPRREQRLAQERLRLHTAIGAARERLYASYPRVDIGQGRSRVPSFYALDLLRAADGELPRLQRLERMAREESTGAVGWPAPRDAERAIDDAEYDLAILRPLLRRPPDEVRGHGRFLLAANRHLRRSLHARARRWRRSWTYADGLMIGGDFEHDPSPERDRATRELLESQRLGARPYSATALQHFFACPYRFALQAIHRLRPRIDVTGFEQLDPLTRGSIFHEMQFVLLSTLRDEGLLPVTTETLAGALRHADRTVDEVAQRTEEELAPAIPRVWRGEVEALRSDLRGWLHRCAELEGAWVPAHFELSFGLPGREQHDPASSETPVRVLDRALLRGAIDLVELDRAGARVRVTDHKTGRARGKPGMLIEGGEILQPVLYALAAEQTEVGAGREVVGGRLFYCTQRGGYEEVEVLLNATSRLAAQQVLDTVDRAIAEGELPALPRERACTWCDYRSVCGPYEELRTARKKPERFEALAMVRRAR